MAEQIEMAALASDDELLHGEAVNIDMALTTHVRSCHYDDQVLVLFVLTIILSASAEPSIMHPQLLSRITCWIHLIACAVL